MECVDLIFTVKQVRRKNNLDFMDFFYNTINREALLQVLMVCGFEGWLLNVKKKFLYENKMEKMV